MFTNYLKIAIRHLWRSKLYTLINVSGLAIGIVCMLLAIVYVKDERSFDDFHEKNPHLYRITTTLVENRGDKRMTSGGTGQVQGPAFKAAVPQVLDYARLWGGDMYQDVVANNKGLTLQLLFADKNFFDLFSFKLLRGDARTALNDIHAVVITEDVARRFFNSIDVVGKTLDMGSDPSAQKLGKPLVVTGVMQNLPRNSSIQFDILLTFEFMRLSGADDNWLNAYLSTFVLLRPDASHEQVIKKFSQVFAIHARGQLAENKIAYAFDPQISYGLQRITDIHLNPLYRVNGNREGGVTNGSDPVFSYIFLGIASFILLMACINFINISTANMLKRSKEVGVRKIAGGSKPQIILQFLVEPALLCAAAFVLSIAFAHIALPLFKQLAGKQLMSGDVLDRQLLLYFIVILTAIILLTGLYPAYLLSGFKPVQVLYGRQKLSGSNAFGKSLIVVQFSLAVFLMIASLIYFLQMDYIRTKKLGYNPHQVIRSFIKGDGNLKSVQQFLRNELAKEPAITSLSFVGEGNFSDVKIEGRIIKAMHHTIDEQYLSTVQIPLKAGRNFSVSFPTDKAKGVIVNEAFVKAAGLQNPLGTNIRTSDYFDKETKTIIGVIKDFHFQSLRQRIEPLVMIMSDWYSGGILVRFEKSGQQQAMAAFEKAWKKAIPHAVFVYDFADEQNAKEYEQEQRWQKVIGLATILSIVICCLGLFGLAHLAAHQRIKEIGIRKVLGASVRSIAALLSMNFIRLVIISIFVASPLAWLVMKKWLQNFAYRINTEWWIFALAGLLTIVIALLALSFQCMKAAMANPVKNLRTE